MSLPPRSSPHPAAPYRHEMHGGPPTLPLLQPLPPADYRIVVLGCRGTGKSALVRQFVFARFVEGYDPTTESVYRKTVTVGNADDRRSIVVDIVDGAGQEEDYSAGRDTQIREADGFILLFSIDSRKSFREIKRIRDQILRIKNVEDSPMIIVGNRTDLDDPLEQQQQQQPRKSSLSDHLGESGGGGVKSEEGSSSSLYSASSGSEDNVADGNEPETVGSEVSKVKTEIERKKKKKKKTLAVDSTSTSTGGSKRQVSVEEGKALAASYGCTFLEVSAKLRQNVDEAFLDLIQHMRLFRAEQKKLKLQKESEQRRAEKGGVGGRTRKNCNIM